jgi:hypothetical protein
VGLEIERASNLVERLYASGGLSQESAEALLAAPDAAADIGNALGEVSEADEILLVTALVDDSTSIGLGAGSIRAGHATLIQALLDEASTADVLLHTRALNRGTISAYERIAKAERLTTKNFDQNMFRSVTPLYLQSLLALGTVMTKTQEEEARGARVRTFTLIITDGGDNESGAISAVDVRALVTDMLEFSSDHIVAGMGVGDPAFFRQTFRDMGIPDHLIFTTGSSADELRAKFRQIAKALRLAASSESGFHQLASGSTGGGS